ncbi:MAG: ABC transporter permease, partial [Paramuribaculum sp.]|nr:ABC transporter permease [Paramuribaculum sp.]
KKKSFIITTLLMPILMIGLMCLPVLIMMIDSDKQKTILVVDNTPEKIFATSLTSDETMRFVITTEPLDSARLAHDVNSILYLPADIVANRNASILIFNNVSASLSDESHLASMINGIITDHRIASYNVEGLKNMMESVKSDVSVKTFSNENTDESESSSTGLSYALGIGLSLLLYMALLIYGQMVMTSIIEEKNNRVLELVVTSVKPFHLMLGKIVGVGLVAVTQLVIWGILIAVGIGLLLPALMPAEMMDQIAQARAGQS